MDQELDHKRLRLRVFEKTGIKIDNDDPIFALVALNEAVLEETYGRHAALIEEATRKLKAQAKKLEQAGALYETAHFGQTAQTAQTEPEPETEPEMRGDDAQQSGAPQRPQTDKPATGAASIDWRWLAGVGASGVLSATLVLCGLWLFAPSRPPAQALQQVQQTAPSLSAEQQVLLRNAEKLNKIVQKLDGKTKSMIRAEMQK